ncbi:MAG TPA: bifunctional UDP-N-acetylglucosamine diphosphorylase/glucosamine-1-phosphate N-acetyltransferase GlmU [Solirubrobacterales bacterium]|nr:bifunctional UDP-N-acetylglucosamine diphosphorylase/glucosamine-1-phosphate N-acetyltransferase GlmU [Solirubrobacterales bacterium]
MSTAPTALIMAAGRGTRMRSSVPKVLHEVCGRPMVAWPILAARAAGAGRVCVIVSPESDNSSALPEGTETVVQPESDGTGGALRAAREVISSSETVLVLSGDSPLLGAEAIAGLIDAHREGGADATVMTTELDDPGTFGRVVRGSSGEVERIVETKVPGDATSAELAIKEVNAGTYAFAAGPLAAALERLSADNAQGEYYLPDVVPLIREAGGSVAAHLVGDPAVNLGVNDRVELARVTVEARRRILRAHMLAGVTVEDPDSTWIDADVELAPDVTLAPGCALRGRTSVGSGSVIGPMTTLTDSRIGERVTVLHSFLVSCAVADGATIGPFSYLRPDAELGPGSKAGAFVEIKNSRIGEGAKVPHLAYVGDSEIGERTNLGAGTITANYDGFRKHRTKVGRGVRTGVDTSLVAPVEVGDGAYTGAGSVITEDVPAGALGISRAEQQNVPGYAERKAKANEEGKASS